MRRLLFLAAWMSALNTIPLYAAELLGKVGAVADKEITVVTTSTVPPRVGDPLEVFVEVPGVGAASVASGKVSAVQNGLINATIERATGKIAFGQQVRIFSNNAAPQIAASAVAPQPVADPAALGFALRNVDQATAELLDLPTAQGCVVTAVTAGSPAEAAGIKKRDVVRKIGGASIHDVAGLEKALAAAPGALKLEIWRDGTMRSVELAPTGSAAVPPETPAQNSAEYVQRLVRAAPDGDLATYWDALPAKYQADVKTVLVDFAESMDKELWNRGFLTVDKSIRVLRSKKEFVLHNPRFAQIPAEARQAMERHWDESVVVLERITASKLKTLDGLKTLDPREFLESVGPSLVKVALELTAALNPSVAQDIKQIREMKVTLLRAEGERAALSFQLPSGPPPENVFVRQDGKWLPVEMVESWDRGVADIRQGFAKSPLSVEERMGLLAAFSLADAAMDQMLAAKSQQDFDAAVEGISSLLGPAVEKSVRDGQKHAAAAAVAAAPVASEAATQDLSQAARRAQHAVILFVAGDKETIGMGTGFVISRKHRLVVTNAHVADLFAIYGSMSAFVNDAGTEHRVDRVWYHPGVLRVIDGNGVGVVRSMNPQIGDVHMDCADLAVVRLSDEGPELPAEMALAGPREIEELLGKPIGLLGFPGSDTKLTDDDLARPQATYHHGVVSRMTDFRMKNAVPNKLRQLVQHTASGVPGASGSPLFLADGRVVGVHSSLRVEATEVYREQTSHGIRIDALWELLAYHKLDDKVPLPVDRATLDTARFDKPDPELEKFKKVWKLLDEAESLFSKEEFAEAGNRCNDAIEIAPDYPYCYQLRCEVYNGYAAEYQKILPPEKLLEQLELAEADAEKVYELQNTADSVLNHALAINNVGVAALKAKQTARAERSHLRAVEMCRLLLEGVDLDLESQARAYSIRCKAMTEMRQYAQALQEISEAVRLQPNVAMFYDERALVYDNLNDPARARADRETATALLRQRIP